jgi:hypothetical protein
MEPVQPEVLQGRNPWWREAWEELDPRDRKAVNEAISRGKRVPDERLLPFVYGLLAISRRRLRWVWLQVLNIELLASIWIYFTCLRPSSVGGFCWLVAIAVLGLAALPTRLALGRRRLGRAEAANLWGRPGRSRSGDSA